MAPYKVPFLICYMKDERKNKKMAIGKKEMRYNFPELEVDAV